MSVLAQLAPVPPVTDGDAHIFYIVVGTLIVLLTLATLAAAFRRRPPIEAEFATKQEMHHELGLVRQMIRDMDARNTNQNQEIFLKIDSIARSFDIGMRELHRSLGRLEGPK